MRKSILLLLAMISLVSLLKAQSEDPYLWLEDIDGKKAMDFVHEQNQKSVEKLSKVKSYQAIYDKSLAIYNSSDRIIYPNTQGDFVYNFWQDKDHVRGLWRRTTKANYSSGNPTWETLLDIDDMSAKDKEKWVFKGASGLYPEYNRFIISLSKGGGDATVKKEFDVNTKKFIEDGFYLPEAKNDAAYLDQNTLVISTDFGEGSLTTSGYPRLVKLWKRGTALKDAQLIFEADTSDVSASGYIARDGEIKYLMIYQGISTFASRTYVWTDNKMVKLDIPEDARFSSLLQNQMVLSLKSDWNLPGKTYKLGSVVSLDFKALLNGQKDVQVVFEPDEFTFEDGISSTKNKLLVNTLSNVKSELFIYSIQNGKWEKEKVNAPDFGSISIADADEFSDQYYFNFTNFLTPSSLYSANAADNSIKLQKSLPAYFDGSKYSVTQFKAKSKDGTMVPYFMISAKGLKYDGKNPTLIYAYGGFEISSLPYYSGITGNAWLEQGGVYILANIRGGGEFGPRWHLDGIKEKRQNVYDDFYAIAEDLINKKVTSNRHLGILGGSNGGLLVGVAFTQRPDLFNAVICAVPLLDMYRYNKLLAGASWMGEFGNPDKPEEWAYIQKYSPYQNVKKGVKYPEVFFTTSTRDDRVHPGHARKMAAKMIDMGYPVLYYENTEGGHAGSSTNEQKAKTVALEYSYLLMKLK